MLRQPSRSAVSARSVGGCRAGQGVDLARLGDVPVLAEAASKVAARRAEGEHRGARQEMVERLLLDGVHAEARRAAITRQHDLVLDATPDEAQPPLALVQLAGARTDIALDPAVGEVVPVSRRHGVRVAQAQPVGPRRRGVWCRFGGFSRFGSHGGSLLRATLLRGTPRYYDRTAIDRREAETDAPPGAGHCGGRSSGVMG